MATNGAESVKAARMPMRPAGTTAAKGGAKKRAQPAIDYGSPCHVPDRAPSHKAIAGTHTDGLGKMAQSMTETKQPVRAPNHMAPAGSATGR